MREYDSRITAYLAYRFAELHASGQTWHQIAADLELSHAHIFNVVKHGRGAGTKMLRSAAVRWFGGSHDALTAAADAWFESNSGGSPGSNEPFPNRAAAVDFASDHVPTEALGYVLTVATPADLPRREWLELIYAKAKLDEALASPAKKRR
jgi:hypothetical protein